MFRYFDYFTNTTKTAKCELQLAYPQVFLLRNLEKKETFLRPKETITKTARLHITKKTVQPLLLALTLPDVHQFLARDVTYTSRAYAMMPVSVCL